MVFPIQRPPNFPASSMRRNPMQHSNPMQQNPMQRMPNNSMFLNQGGNQPANILSRLFQSRQISQQGALPLSQRAVGGLSSTLNNVQQVLKIIQSTAPIVQQYGPMVKNLPVMFKLMKALKEDDENPTDLDESVEQENITTKSESVEQENTIAKSESVNNSKQPKNEVNNGLSKPKLFI